MEIGKVPEEVLQRSVFNRIKKRRPEVLVHPGIGEDCAVLQFDKDEAMVISTDPITGTINDIGTLAVHITVNDLASAGADAVGILQTIILPPGTPEADLVKVISEMEEVCNDLNIEIIGGHTEVSKAVTQPLISITGIGKIRRDHLITTAGLRPGQELVLTKWAGLEGSAILAADLAAELADSLPEDMLERARSWKKYLSVLPESRIATRHGVSAMHDVTEGGVLGALWEMASAGGVGVAVDLAAIPVREETRAICSALGLDPYKLISSGCMLIAVDDGAALAASLREAGIPAAVIARATAGADKYIVDGDARIPLAAPGSDELYKAYDRSVEVC